MIALIEPIQEFNPLLQEVDKKFLELFCKKNTLTPIQQEYVMLLEKVFIENDDYSDQQAAMLFANINHVTHPLLWPHLDALSINIFYNQLILFKLL